MTNPFDEFVSSLERRGFSYDETTGRAQCPGHGNSESGFNLAVTESDTGNVLLRCFSHGCSSHKICQNMGISEGSLFAGKDYKPGAERKVKEVKRKETASQWIEVFARSLGEPTQIHDYFDERMELVGQVLRFDKEGGTKEFRQTCRTADGMWEAHGMPVPRPMYNLPNLPDAEKVYVVEGEKAVDALTAAGYTATTGTQGSSAAQKTDWSPLKGKEVIILPDNDEQGVAWADKVFSLLPECDACVVDMASVHFDRGHEFGDGNDIYDLLALDANVMTLVTAAARTKSKSMSAAPRFAGSSVGDLWEMCDEPVDWIVEDAFSADQPTVIGAKQKSLKTTLLSDLAVALATGTEWCGHFVVPRPRRTLFITGESSARGSMRRIRRAVEARGLGRYDIGEQLRVETLHFPNLPDQSDCDAVAEVVLQFGIEIVIVDPLYMGLSGVSTTNLTEVGPALRNFKVACYPASMILAHHVKKSTDYSDAPNLEDLSQAGIAEFAGNYMLLGRLSEYKGDGKHELAVRMGGRDDQFGLHKLDFDEVSWTADFTSLTEWREMQEVSAELEKEEKKFRSEKALIMGMIRQGPVPEKSLGRKKKTWSSTLTRLVDEGTVTFVEGQYQSPDYKPDENLF